MRKELQKQCARDVIREIADQLHALTREQETRIEFERVDVQYFQSLMSETVA